MQIAKSHTMHTRKPSSRKNAAPRWVWLATLIAISFTPACTTRLHMRDGSEIAGDLEGADDRYVYIVLDPPETSEESATRHRHAEPRNDAKGRRDDGAVLHRVRRDAVDDVSFPGLALGIAGSIVMTVGASVALAGLISFVDCGGQLCGLGHLITTFPGSAVGAAGLGMMIPGWALYSSSAAKMQNPPDYDLSVAPTGVTVSW